MRTVFLSTPSLPLIVPGDTFDAFDWCPGTTLEWRAPTDTIEVNPLDDALPLRMVFVFRAPWSVLPAELARLHTGRPMANALGLSDQYALAPYAIDDATDGFHLHHRAPTDTFWLATDNLNGLYWSLHDWAHFHNHGPFTDRPATEYQCDTAALAWVWRNRHQIPITEAQWETLRGEVHLNHLRHRAREPDTHCPSPKYLADSALLRGLADQIA